MSTASRIVQALTTAGVLVIRSRSVLSLPEYGVLEVSREPGAMAVKCSERGVRYQHVATVAEALMQVSLWQILDDKKPRPYLKLVK